MPRAASERDQTAGPGHTRRRILEAAKTLFAESGYAGTSVRMIARSLGLSDPAVYYHFPTKHDLYLALLVEPDYGALPLHYLPLSRETMVAQVLHLFSWWTSRPELGQMLLREQLSGEEASVAFIGSSDQMWYEAVTAPLSELLGTEAEDVSAMLFDLLAGVFWDAILSYGGHFAETVAQEYFQSRVRAMIDLAIPGRRLAGA